MKIARPSWSSVFLAAFAAAASVLAILESGPPPPLGDDAPGEVFSAGRAMTHVRAIARAPHPTGSPEAARVREYIASELVKLGFTVERQPTTAVRLRGRGSRARGVVLAGSVENLMVRLPGTASGGAVLLAAHYDSVPAGPGAADDASGVAALLETLRALKTGSALRNDVIALFTEGEEDGLLGAEAFVSRHPWAADVRVALNFEARGRSGPVQMFETTPGNLAIVSAWAAATAAPAGASLAYEVYQRLPNDTDFTEFRRMDAVGLNFAFIGDPEVYHTPLDAPDALDQGSLQGTGDAALALARRFGDASLDLRDWRSRDAVYFSVPGGLVFRYSALAALPLAVLGAIFWLWAFVRARRADRTSVGGTLVAFVLVAAVLAVEAWFGWKWSGWLSVLQRWHQPLAAPLGNSAYALAIVLFTVAGWLIVLAVLRRWLAAHSVSLAAALLMLLAAGTAAALLPGTSYLFVWPAVTAVAAALLLPGPKGAQRAGGGAAVLLALLAIPAIAILAPTGATLFTALGVTREGATGLVLLTSLGMLALLPQWDAVAEGRRWWPAIVACLAGFGASGAGFYTAPYGPEHPRPENLVYALDADAGRAVWATAADPPGEWLGQYVTHDPKRGPLAHFAALAGATPFASTPAAALDLAGPAVTVTRSTREDGGRLLAVRVTSPRRARVLSVRIPEREILETRVNGRLAGRDGDGAWAVGRWGLEYVNVPEAGIDITIRVRGSGPVTLVVADRSDGVPEVPGAAFRPRPSSSMPVHRGDLTVVQRTFTF